MKRVLYKDAKGRWAKKENAAMALEKNVHENKYTRVSDAEFDRILQKISNAVDPEKNGIMLVEKAEIEPTIIKLSEEESERFHQYTVKTSEITKLYEERLFDKEFKYYPYAGKKFNLDENEQRKIYNLFRDANYEINKLREEFDLNLGIMFSYNLDNILMTHSFEKAKELWKAKVDRAKDIVNGVYIEKLAEEYKLEFISAFEKHIDESDFEKLINLVRNIDKMDFLRYLKETKQDFEAYALESRLNAGDFETIDREVRAMIQDLASYVK